MAPTSEETPLGQTGQPRWRRLGQVLHWISFIKFVFYLLGLFFQIQTIFFSRGDGFLSSLNTTLLMYGIAMSFESLRDNERVPERERRSYHARPRFWAWFLAFVFIGVLFAIAAGCLQFFLTRNRDLGWAISTFGLGMIALGRQQYDQLTFVLSKRG